MAASAVWMTALARIVCIRQKYCAALYTASTTAVHRHRFHSHVASSAVHGHSAKPTASCCASVLYLAARLAGIQVNLVRVAIENGMSTVEAFRTYGVM